MGGIIQKAGSNDARSTTGIDTNTMIVLNYGMTKSGSTLEFELCKSVLEQEGYVQRRLEDGTVTEGHHINFINNVKLETLQRLVTAVPENEKISVKTHAPIERDTIPFVEQSIAEGRMKVHVNCRDPREVCLSLVDAGIHARENTREAFSEVHSLADAAKVATRQLKICRRWGSIEGASIFFYNDVAFDMRRAVDTMCADFGFAAFNEDQYKMVVSRVVQDAFTQKNKAVKDRYKDDLTVRESEFLLDEIPQAKAFIRNVCEKRDLTWFSAARHALVDGSLTLE